VFLGKSISEAPAIARASNYPAVNTATFVPPQNTPITIPASTNAEDDADDHAPYNESAIDVRLNPHMPMPLIRIKPPTRHIAWWKKDLIIGLDVAMSVALAIAIPGAGAELAGVGADLLEDVLADAIVGAAFSAASSIGAQGLNEITGLSNGLDMTDVMWSSIDGAVSGGGAEGFGLNLPGLQVSSELTASTLENVEKLAILQTAFLYATGQTKTFEWKQLAVTLMSTLANAGANRFASKMISNQSLWTQQLMANSLKGAANEGISEVMFGSAPTAESAAVNALGITLGQGLVRESELAFGGSGFANHSTVLSHKRLARTLDEQEAKSLDNAFSLKNYGVQTNAYGAAIAGQGQPAFVNQGHLGPANDARFADRVKAATSTTARAASDEARDRRSEFVHLAQEHMTVNGSTRMMRAAQHSSWEASALHDVLDIADMDGSFNTHFAGTVGHMAANLWHTAIHDPMHPIETLESNVNFLYHLTWLTAVMSSGGGGGIVTQALNSPQAQAFYGRLTSSNDVTRAGAYGSLFGGAAFVGASLFAGGAADAAFGAESSRMMLEGLGDAIEPAMFPPRIGSRIERNSAYRNALFSRDFRQTQAASSDLIDSVSSKRNLFVAQAGSDDLRFLEIVGADAAAGGPGNLSIIVRGEQPQKLTLIEEFLHGTQSKIWGDPDTGVATTAFREWHVRDFMYRHQSMFAWDADELSVLGTERKYWSEQLEGVQNVETTYTRR
jgi:hypothetical protein